MLYRQLVFPATTVLCAALAGRAVVESTLFFAAAQSNMNDHTSSIDQFGVLAPLMNVQRTRWHKKSPGQKSSQTSFTSVLQL